jgi:uncharacterized protein
MSFHEQALQFDCGGETLIGVASVPATPAVGSCAVLIVVGGPQYRAGSHRQFVSLARRLAASGHLALRFDVRGMGDSSGAQRDFESLSDDIGAAIDAIGRLVGQGRPLVLFGLCDGASASLLYLHGKRDARVRGLCLLNPWARSVESLARTHLKHYYTRRLMDPAFWRKLLGGGVGLQRLREFLGAVKTASGGEPQAAGMAAEALPFQQAMAAAWRSFAGPILLALSSEDITAREFVDHAAHAPAWRGLLERAGVQRLDLAGADHTLSEPGAQQAFEAAMIHWLQATLDTGPPTSTSSP